MDRAVDRVKRAWEVYQEAECLYEMFGTREYERQAESAAMAFFEESDDTDRFDSVQECDRNYAARAIAQDIAIAKELSCPC